MANGAQVDVAISFLAKDEPTAAELYSRLRDGLNVFFFPRNQEELAGTAGLESMRAPFLEARVVVVLFHTPWGETPWTRVEQTAITDRALKDGWDFILFVTLDSTSLIPNWVPNTRIRFNMETYGIEQAVGAIKFRVEQMGGEISKPSPMALAKRVKEEQDLKEDQERFFRDQKWITETAKPTVENLIKTLQEQAQKITDETGIQFEYGYEPYYAGFICVVRYGRVTLHVGWVQMYTNVIDDVKLQATEYNGRLHLQKERKMYLREPSVMNRRSYRPALNLSRELRWVNEKKPGQLLANDDVVHEIIEQLLGLVDRLNKGKISSPDYDD
jgi:hypothetical protein